MESTLMIKDLSVSKELGREELAAVRGGFAFAGGVNAIQGNNGGGGFVNVNNITNAPTAIDARTNLNLDLTSINQLAGRDAGAFKL